MSAQVGGKESEVKAVLKQQFIHIHMLFNEGLGGHKVFLKQAALLLTTDKEQQSDCQRHWDGHCGYLHQNVCQPLQ